MKQHNQIYKDATVVLNGTAYVDCQFRNCNLEVIDDPSEGVALINCKVYDCKLVGSGWNYDLIEAWESARRNNTPLNWKGPVGNREVTKH
jgi:hypothetical protein